ncbi:hypothetical protein NBE98_21730 [Clostridium swellfunianum]|nr:hypothetical protein [Clostridium swellfunianum]
MNNKIRQSTVDKLLCFYLLWIIIQKVGHKSKEQSIIIGLETISDYKENYNAERH